MKKTLAILSALVALVACSKEAPIVEEPAQKENQEIKVNITINRTEMGAETKANIKSGWANDDVVYVFFSEATAPAYLEMKYNSSTKEWTATPKNELNLATLDGSGSMWAIYLPYGSEYKVIADGTSYTIKSKATDGENYSGHFFYCEPQDYTISESTLSGKISLSVAAPKTEGDVLVHFDVTNPVAGSEYLMYQEYMKPMSLSSISAAGIINKAVGALGDAIPGYKDASFVSFSGVLGKNYKGNNSYWFSIRDTELGTLYYRDAGSHAISANKYIGLGKLTGDGKSWSVATPGEFSVSPSKKVTFARSNLAYMGASAPEGKKWQFMKYPWSTIEVQNAPITGENYAFTPGDNVDFSLFGWATSGYVYNEDAKNPWMTSTNNTDYGPSDSTDGNEWSRDWDWGKMNDIYEYGGIDPYGYKNSWRTPTKGDFEYILFNRTYEYRYAKGIVNGDEMRCLIIFPDGFTVPDGITIRNANSPSAYYSSNNTLGYHWTIVMWNKLEAAGVVFLPAAGIRSNNNGELSTATWMNATSQDTSSGNYYPMNGRYRTSTIKDAGKAYRLAFHNGTCAMGSTHRFEGFSVRLVRDLN